MVSIPFKTRLAGIGDSIRALRKDGIYCSNTCRSHQSPILFQYLQAGPAHTPPNVSFALPDVRNFGIWCAKMPKSLRKTRAARAMTTIVTGKSRGLAPHNRKNEDPAKMAYSIPDLVSCNATNPQYYSNTCRKFYPYSHTILAGAQFHLFANP